jgi:hypothetical protein
MVTVHRAFGFRFAIYANDHGPPHVHVLGAGGAARILLTGPGGVRPDWIVGIGRADLRRILREVERQKGQLLREWRRIHGEGT